MSQQSGPLPDTSNTVAPHRNHGLFSDYFLAQHVPTLEGDNLAAAQALQSQTLNLCRNVEARVAGRREASVEEDLIRPVLRLLGFAYVPNPPLPTGDATDAPDYALFASAEAKRQAGNYGEREFYAGAIAIAEAKKWDRPLSATTKRSRRAKDRKHPGKQIRDYLYESGVKWGILTNGRLWRLYEREASRGENFYEVDLLGLARNPDPQAWRFFYLFFRREAFEPEADGRCPLDKWLTGSKDYALGLTKRLRGNVYKALRLLMEGFFARPDNGLDWERDRKRVHEASLVLLYRLLFVFYAEARGLMPLTNARYRDRYSLAHHKSEIAKQLDASRYDEVGSGLWSWLRDELFELVDKGNPQLGVPQYNGGLFRRDNWPLLHDPNIRLPDQHVAQAIDLLSRDKSDGVRGFVDYSELGVRELGSIYEGLLEMRPHMAKQPMIEVKRGSKDKGAEVIPEAQATQDQKAWNLRNKAPRYGRAEVYLLTDRGERKQTGSYYTPEYIVNYIVENTLNPLLSECARKVADQRSKTEGDIAPLERAIAERGDDANAGANRAEIERLKLELLEPYFSLKVLDPAMGSGHFLVGAADFITDAILTDPNHIPPTGADGEDEALYYKRRVVERCLYGVDINPLAVELAKLSLWLHTVQKGRALSFLDHHLRCGNSLIGAWVGELSQLPAVTSAQRRERAKLAQTETAGQQSLNLFEQVFDEQVPWLLEGFRRIEDKPTVTAADDMDKVGWFEALEGRRDRFRDAANLWLASYFGNQAPDYEQTVGTLRQDESWHTASQAARFATAQKLAQEHRFFHWELEFPEVWYERGRRKDNPGFDAVIGNPPYGRVGAPSLQLYVRSRFRASEFKVDTYSLFSEQGSKLSRAGGRFSFIVPVTFATNSTEKRLRRFLMDCGSFERFLTFPGDVFEEAVVHSIVFVWHCAREPGDAASRQVFVDQFGGSPRSLRIGHILAQPGDQLLLFQGLGESELLEKIRSASQALGAEADVRQCIKTGDDNRYLLHRQTDPRHKPVAGGAHMDRYEWRPPAALFVDYGDWLACPREPRIFEQTKLVVREAGARLACAKDEDHYYLLSSVYACIPYEGRRWRLGADFLLGVLNSALMNWTARKLALESTSGAFTKLRIYQVEALPLRRIHFTTPAKERAALVEDLKGMYREWVKGEDSE